MMKFNRILSVAAVMTMAFTMFASAANLDADDDNKAEEMKTGTVYVVEEDGTVTESTFEYSLPTDATEEEEADIASQAARVAVDGETSMLRASNESCQEIRKLTKIPFDQASSSTGAQLFENVKLAASGGRMEFYISNVTGPSSINVSIQNAAKTGFWQSRNLGTAAGATIVFYNGGIYPNYTLYFDTTDRYNGFISGNTAGSAYVRVRYFYQ